MGHLDISDMMGAYTQIGFVNVKEESKRTEEFRKIDAEILGILGFFSGLFRVYVIKLKKRIDK